MRLVVLTQYFPPEVGAPQVRLHAIAQRLQKMGHTVTVVTAMPNYPYGSVFPAYRRRIYLREIVDGVMTIRTWLYAATGKQFAKRVANYTSFALTSLFGCLAAGDFDHVLVESPPLFLGVTGFVASRLRRRDFTLYVSDLWPASAKELGLLRDGPTLKLAESVERFLYRSAGRVVCVTEGICDEIVRSGVPSAKVRWVPNGVDTDLFRPTVPVPTSDVRKGEVVFLYAGTHGYAQGLEVILDAARLLLDLKTVVFLLVGDGPTKAAIQDRAITERLTNVRFAAAQPLNAMPAYFSASRASIVPLRSSPLFRSARPSKILPSLACEIPVIYCGEGETAQLMQTEECGLVVAPEDAEGLARAVTTLTENPLMAAEMGRKGRELAMAQYSWDAIVRNLAAVLEES